MAIEQLVAKEFN